MKKFDSEMENQKREIPLVVDNTPYHIVTNLDLKAIKFLFLPKNATSKVHPLDAGNMHTVKKRYQNFHLQNASYLEEMGPNIYIKLIKYKP